MTRSPLLSRRAFGLATATLPVVLAAPGRAQGALWSMATEYPANTVSGDAIAFFAEQLARESGGHLTVRPVTDAAMGKSAEIVGAILQGGLAAGDSFSGALGGVDPIFLLSSLPFVATTEADAARLLERARPLYAAAMARHRQRLLYASPWPPSGLWAKKPIVSLADLKGLRVRVYDSTGVSVFAAAGASPANLSFADVMPRLKDGSIDAVLSSGDGGAGRGMAVPWPSPAGQPCPHDGKRRHDHAGGEAGRGAAPSPRDGRRGGDRRVEAEGSGGGGGAAGHLTPTTARCSVPGPPRARPGPPRRGPA
jgi:TRAP-type C4-dicarboxylate transport system substrate-binding protein